MSQQLRLIFNPPREKDHDGVGDHVGANFQALEALADEYCLKRLSDFVKKDGWFPIRAGVMCCDSLANIIYASPDAAKRLSKAEQTIDDLYAIVRLLTLAAARKATFRFELADGLEEQQQEAA